MKLRTLILLLICSLVIIGGATAQEAPEIADGGNADDALAIPFVNLEVREPQSNNEVALSLQLLLLLSVLTLAPSIVLLTTSFLRIAVVLDFIKRALNLQQVPPNQVLMGVALFLTLFIMWPTLDEIYTNSFKPFADGEIDTEQMYDGAVRPLRLFMYKQLNGNHDTIALFMRMSGRGKAANFSEVPTYILIPAYVLHELTVAFKIGILLFVPFICIDLVVASTLMSMGMIMLPPIMISLPFKLILFVLVDGWGLITRQIIASFN